MKLYSIRLFSQASFPFPFLFQNERRNCAAPAGQVPNRENGKDPHPKFFYPFVAHSVTNLSPYIIAPQITMSPQRMGYGDRRDLKKSAY